MTSSKTAQATPGEVPAGGMWERQRVFGGLRLDKEFAAEETFILRGLKAGGEVPLELSETPVPKTILVVSRMSEPDKTFEVGTLASPIAAMVPEATDSDFPVIAFWTTVPTDQPSDATVLQAVGAYTGK